MDTVPTKTEANRPAAAVERTPRRWFERVARLAIGAILLSGLPGLSHGVEYGADLAFASIYSNNVTLAPDNLSKTQWVNALVPRVYLTHVAPRYEIDVDYRLEALFYPGESDLNGVYSDLWAGGNFGLVKDELFLDGFGRITQVNVDPERQNSNNNLYVTGNRTDAVAVWGGPRWQRYLFNDSEIDTSYYVGRIEYDDDTIQGVDTQDAQLSINSTILSTSRFSYDLFWRYRNYDYDDTGPVKFQKAQLELGYFFNPYFQVAGLVGSESNLGTNDGKLDEPFWEVGFRSWFRQDFIEAFYGERFYGPTYRFTWRREMRDSTIRVTYRETQDTDEGAALGDLGTDFDAGINPNQDSTLTPATGIDRPGTGARSVNKVGRADFRRSLYRTDLRLSALWRDREEIASLTVPGMQTTTEDQSIGAEFQMSWDLGVRTVTSLIGGWTQRKFDTNQEDSGNDSDNYRLDARVDYRLGMLTDLYLQVGYQTQESTNLSYDELHAGVGFRRYFLRRSSGGPRGR